MSANSSWPSTPSNQPDATITSHPAHKLLSQAHAQKPTPPTAQETTAMFTDKILHKPLLLHPSTENQDKRSARRHIRLRKSGYARKHAKPKPLSAKEKRSLGLYDLNPETEECRYQTYLGLNALWNRYILEVLGYLDRQGRVVKGRIGKPMNANTGGGNFLASADYHGMMVEVVRCRDVCRVGLKGIVVRETRSTFTLVCNEREDGNGRAAERRQRLKLKQRGDEKADQEGQQQGLKRQRDGDEKRQYRDKVRMILKKGSVFRVSIELPGIEAESKTKQLESTTSAGHGQREDAQLTDEIMQDSNAGQTENPSQRSQEGDEDQPLGTKRIKRELVFELHGDQLEIRPVERAVKKFKWRAMDYL